eukprot:TRINITY_DN74602_c0_g1_i1.p1 TRINITY_DN74602_c0_g1~~TRINITY_DN74602_c0_g1_i1.p1  ORF type:complete len:803 (-),score=205.59 TRINITY_DN74602_c0_g1_i1:70-2478(-)
MSSRRTVCTICTCEACCEIGLAHILVADVEELAYGQCEVVVGESAEPCKKHPSVSLKVGSSRKRMGNVNSFAKVEQVLFDIAGLQASGLDLKVGKLKYRIRRETSEEKRTGMFDEAFSILNAAAKGGASSSKTEAAKVDRLSAQVHRLRAEQFCDAAEAATMGGNHLRKRHAATRALEDALKAAELLPKWAVAYLTLSHAYEMSLQFAEARKAVQKARDLGYRGDLREDLERIDASEEAEKERAVAAAAEKVAASKAAKAPKGSKALVPSKRPSKDRAKDPEAGVDSLEDMRDEDRAEEPVTTLSTGKSTAKYKKLNKTPSSSLQLGSNAATVGGERMAPAPQVTAADRRGSSGSSPLAATPGSRSRVRTKSTLTHDRTSLDSFSMATEEDYDAADPSAAAVEWTVERAWWLNHNCARVRLKCLDVQSLGRSRHQEDVWHVVMVAEFAFKVKDFEYREEVTRSYTPLTSVQEYLAGRMDLMVKVYPEGKMSQALASGAGTLTVKISPPLPLLIPERYRQGGGGIVIAGGSAITTALQFCQQVLKRWMPTPSMEEDADWDSQEFEEEPEVAVWLLLCNTTRKDVVHRDQLGAMIEAHPKFQLIHVIESGAVLTDNSPQISWRSGRLSPAVLRDAAQSGLQAVVSGPPGLCKAAVEAWRGAGRDIEDMRVLDELPDDMCLGPPVEPPRARDRRARRWRGRAQAAAAAAAAGAADAAASGPAQGSRGSSPDASPKEAAQWASQSGAWSSEAPRATPAGSGNEVVGVLPTVLNSIRQAIDRRGMCCAPYRDPRDEVEETPTVKAIV